MSETAQTIYLKDYKPHAFKIEDVFLEFELDDTKTIVKAISKVARNRAGEDFILDGHSMELLSVTVDDIEIASTDYILDNDKLILPTKLLPTNDFTLVIVTQINPKDNTSLEGLYRSGSMYCTQCESQGFRKITYFIDRPDNMARYTVKIIGEKDKFPILLANGNKLESGKTSDGRPYALWQDPFKKPCYLFALVAGDLAVVKDSFTTMSGRKVDLEIYVEHGNESKCDYAMDSLKRSMKWDEEAYGREYDLDLFMIVAVSDFNFGAMENKGLNVFNSKYILADAHTATDTDYEHIEGVVAHEYFHNWTGNRVTCRDWFQLCLKEGLTVFRDQSFSGDMRSKMTKRIDDVLGLRNNQFGEDAGPLAHNVRPESYIEINNFYTSTVYEKGAELCRMLSILLGVDGFRKGCDLYFERFDGMAVTVEDFVQALSDANKKDLSNFMTWYKQAGTPQIDYKSVYDESSQNYRLILSQRINPTPNQESKKPVLMPVVIAFLSRSGQPLEVSYQGKKAHEHILEFEKDSQEFIFEDVSVEPILSLFRGFSAPIILNEYHTVEESLLLMAHDTDGFNRYEAGQKLASKLILGDYNGADNHHDMMLYVDGVRRVLGKENDNLYKSYFLGLPSVSYLMQSLQKVNPQKLYTSRKRLRLTMAEAGIHDLEEAYSATRAKLPFSTHGIDVARRAYNNALLSYLVTFDASFDELAKIHYQKADNMTDKIGALTALSERGGKAYLELLEKFYEEYKDDALVIDKWFALQARMQNLKALDMVKSLLKHKDFTYKNPNRVRSLIGVFAHGNVVGFHQKASYDFVAEQILIIDKINPKTAARLATAFEQIHLLDDELAGHARNALEKILKKKSEISKDLFEIVSKTLG